MCGLKNFLLKMLVLHVYYLWTYKTIKNNFIMKTFKAIITHPQNFKPLGYTLVIILFPIYVGDLSRRSWSPAASGPPGLSTAIFVAVDGPPGPIMAATDGPPLPQVVPPVYFNPIQLVE